LRELPITWYRTFFYSKVYGALAGSCKLVLSRSSQILLLNLIWPSKIFALAISCKNAKNRALNLNYFSFDRCLSSAVQDCDRETEACKWCSPAADASSSQRHLLSAVGGKSSSLKEKAATAGVRKIEMTRECGIS